MTKDEIKRLEKLGEKIFQKNYRLTEKELCDNVKKQSITKEI